MSVRNACSLQSWLLLWSSYGISYYVRIASTTKYRRPATVLRGRNLESQQRV